MKKLEYNEFEPLFGKWAPLFRNFIEGEEMFDIYQTLKNSKETIVPKSDDTFNAFKKSKPEDIKVIWYLQDPYPRAYKNGVFQATGIAMDCSNSPDGRLQPSLEKFYETAERETEMPVQRSTSLEYLLEQGVLLLNTGLTCKLLKSGSHTNLWLPFHKYFLETVMRSNTGMVYVLSGDESQKVLPYINPLGNFILKTSHPANAAHNKIDWDSGNIFNKINNYLRGNKKEPVYWDRDLWEKIKDLPF